MFSKIGDHRFVNEHGVVIEHLGYPRGFRYADGDRSIDVFYEILLNGVGINWNELRDWTTPQGDIVITPKERDQIVQGLKEISPQAGTGDIDVG